MPGAGTCWAFMALLSCGSEWKNSVTGNGEMVVSGIVETICGFQLHIISDYKQE